VRILYLIALAALFLASCGDRAGELDALIRAEPSLVRLEQQLDWTLDAAEAGPALRDEQRRWREGLERCLDAEDPAHCVGEAHRERLDDLQERFGLTPRGVALDAAARAGYAFRAMGNEPGWNLLLSEGHCVWETDYGQVRHELRDLEYEASEGSRRYRGRLDGDPWEVRLDRESCADDMSGEAFPWRATIEYRGQTLRGCAEPTTP
jgi:uncharacterized membrane protein